MEKANGKYFTDEVLSRIRETISNEPSISRRQLSLRVCEWMDWKNPATNKLQEMSCRKALLELDHREVITLPVLTKTYAFQKSRKIAPPAITPIDCPLKELGEIELVRVGKGPLAPVWRSMMDEWHYLKSGPLCGEQIRYLIRSEQVGWVGALSYSACALSVESRDSWIGWGPRAKKSNRHLLVNNSRFLIPPMVKVQDLASHVLAMGSAQLADDWQAVYNYRPVMLETYVERGRFQGSCYAGAGWLHVGKTKGRGRKNGPSVPVKDVYLQPLHDEWRNALCTVDGKTQVLTPARPADEPRDWIEEELGQVDLGDRRLSARLLQLTGQFYEQPTASIPQACGSAGGATAAYRFLDNERVDWRAILRSHFQATEDRLRHHPLVLVAQDTTSLNYSNLTQTTGLGPICDRERAQGMIVHDTLCFTPKGTPLGLLDVQCWSRGKIGISKQRKNRPIEEKESYKWLSSFQEVSQVQRRCANTRLVLISDRESDLYELFTEHQKTKHAADLLIRANRSNDRNATDDQEQISNLWDLMSEQPVSCQKEILVPPAPKRPARKASLAVRFAPITLQPPTTKAHLPPVTLWAIYASEQSNKSTSEDIIDWMLFTTVETHSAEDALERIEWYAKRWGIEVYHRIFKSGCNVERRQLGTATRLKNCLAIDLVVAWRIFYLTMQGREAPDVPCTIYFAPEEWKALTTFMTQTTIPPKQPPTLNEAVGLLAKLGGHLGRTHDDPPGSEVLWRGLSRLADISDAYRLYAEKNLNN
jgi:hypothetical protein